MNPADYGRATRSELVDEYIAQADVLGAHHVVLSNALADRERDFWLHYDNAAGDSVSARAKAAQSATAARTVEVIEVRGEINEITTRLNTIRLILGQREMVSTGATFPPDKGLEP
jgi:hypothetical protein